MKDINTNTKNGRKRIWKYDKTQTVSLIACAILLSFSIVIQSECLVFAAGDADTIITTAFDSIYDIVAAIISSIGSLILLWGVFEWSQSMSMQDGGAQAMAFKRIASGVVSILVPQLIPVITSSING